MTNGPEFIFFDVRDTLGYVDRRGHLVPFRPSTERMLQDIKDELGARMGVITNLPADVPAEAARTMLREPGLLEFLDPEAVIVNHEVGHDKPGAEIYQAAADKVGVPIERCLFIGENFIEVIGAMRAGMMGLLKPFPPGGEFLFKPRMQQPADEHSSGRIFEELLEEEHLLGKRIVEAAAKVAEKIEAGEKPVVALALLVNLLQNFVDPYHHRKEEEGLMPLALARGLPADLYDQTIRDHDQGRLYFSALEVIVRRIQHGDERALPEAALILHAFVSLYHSHAVDENDHLFPEIGKYLTDTDDAIVVELLRQIGPAELTPWLALVQSLEVEVGIEN